MIQMILKMSAIVALYVAVTMFLWMRLRNRKLSLGLKVAIGLLYGGGCILSTHFGVDYGPMMLNVRDIGPLAAGLFFDPLSGIIAGVVGGVERYIAGTYWGVGSYTRIACSVSTCLAGFLAAFLNRWIFKGKKPSVTYAFFMGAVMEVFHMYAVFITHRNDMEMAFYVVRTCAVPMIVFTGLGVAICSAGIRILSGEWENPFRHLRSEQVPVSTRFQGWLFVVTFAVLLVNFFMSYLLQTQSAGQNARDTLINVGADIRETYNKVEATQKGIESLAESMVLTDARAIADAVDRSREPVDVAFLERQRSLYDLRSVTLVDGEGREICDTGASNYYSTQLADVMAGKVEYQVVKLTSRWAVAGARCDIGVIQAVIDAGNISQRLNEEGLSETMSLFHVGKEGFFDIISTLGYSIAGEHRDMIHPEWRVAVNRCKAGDSIFNEEMFGVKCLCRVEQLENGSVLLEALPVSEVYANRDIHAYETALADILLFTVIYVLISLLVQEIVVNNLKLVNESLSKITGGDLNEVVNVRNSSEFASLSDDINQTVTVLKGYISAAEKRIEQELELARTIQDAALPKNFRFPRQDFEIFATMDPAKEVGGDFYDFFFIDSDHLGLVIADVSGKGIPAALFMMRSKTAIRGLAQTGNAPSEILYQANNALCEGNDAEMFVTAWIGIIDLRTGEMRCANAGHEYPVLMRAGGEYELFKDKHALALAAMEGVPFKEYELKFCPGDRLFVYTDGIPEAIDANTEQYGVRRLTDKLNALRSASMEQTLPAVRQDIADFAGAVEQFDDITMLGFVYYGNAEGRNQL